MVEKRERAIEYMFAFFFQRQRGSLFLLPLQVVPLSPLFSSLSSLVLSSSIASHRSTPRLARLTRPARPSRSRAPRCVALSSSVWREREREKRPFLVVRSKRATRTRVCLSFFLARKLPLVLTITLPIFEKTTTGPRQGRQARRRGRRGRRIGQEGREAGAEGLR